MKKIGIMGGTFNPIHYAHLIIAQCAVEKFGLDKIIFITTGNPVHKPNECIEDAKYRHNMVELAILSNPLFEASDMEVKRNEPTYTIDTLQELKAIYPDSELTFIIGTDSLNKLSTWKNSEKLFDYSSFAVATRPFYDLESDSCEFIERYSENIKFFEVPINAISSTEIRKKINLGHSITYLVPEKVVEYIQENSLYEVDFFQKYDRIVKQLRENLTEKRFNHSIEVAKISKKLAINYNLIDYDVERAFLAGLLHDCAKCFDKVKIFETANKYNYHLDEILQNQPDLAHSFLGYFVAKNEYDFEICDEDLLNSIKYHTTGRENMSTLEKIVYIADYIEPTRPAINSIEQARILAYDDLDKTMLYILENTIEFNKSKGRLIHYLSEEAYEFYKN